MTQIPLGTFWLSTKVINRNVAAVDASDAIEIKADVAVDVSKTTQKEIDVLPTFISKMSEFQQIEVIDGKSVEENLSPRLMISRKSCLNYPWRIIHITLDWQCAAVKTK